MKNKISISLFILYFIQYLIPLKFAFLENLQQIELYKKWSGFILLLFILSQWYLSFMRINKDYNASKKEVFLDIHKWIGVLLPIVFYVHSTNIGYGVLLLLSFVFYLNLAIGLINTNDILAKHPKYFNIWLVSHILFSVAVLIISFVHVWLVFYYN